MYPFNYETISKLPPADTTASIIEPVLSIVLMVTITALLTSYIVTCLGIILIGGVTVVVMGGVMGVTIVPEDDAPEDELYGVTVTGGSYLLDGIVLRLNVFLSNTIRSQSGYYLVHGR